VHVSVVWVLIEQFRIETLIANLLAFLTAFVVSFTGQYLWTFRSNRNWDSALPRFFSVSFAGFIFNNIVLISLLDMGFMSDAHAAMISACIIPVVTYLAGRFWAFK
jgi:putative flippase GtrA